MCSGKKKRGQKKKEEKEQKEVVGEPESCFQISFRLLSYAIMMNLGLIPSAPDQLPLPTLPTVPTPPAALLTAALLALCKAGTNFWFAGQAKCLILKRYRSSNLRGQCSRRERGEGVGAEGNVQKCHKARAHKQLESGDTGEGGRQPQITKPNDAFDAGENGENDDKQKDFGKDLFFFLFLCYLGAPSLCVRAPNPFVPPTLVVAVGCVEGSCWKRPS